MTPAQAPLAFIVFVAGISTMAVEMLAARLIAPFYGTSLLVWTVLLFSILVALTVGYFRGGRKADRDPRVDPLARTLLIASGLLALVPLLGLKWLQICGSPEAFMWKTVGPIASHVMGLIGTVIFLCVPVSLLGSVGPYVIRLRAKDPLLMGRDTGTILGLSTLGSIIGTYLPALFGIPVLGTYYSFLALSLMIGFASVLIADRSWRPVAVGVGLVVPLVFIPLKPQFLRPGESIDGEWESVYNTIQIKRQKVNDGRHAAYERVMLILNEGYAVHSITMDDTAWCHPLVGSVWDYMGLLPTLSQPEGNALDVAIVGLAGGTVARQLLAFYKGIYETRVEGAEIDPLIIKLAQDPKYFRLPPEVSAHAQDGRAFLARSKKSYDLIVTDAYRQPYIPFHLTTVEYFTIVRDHLKPRGICSINVGSTSPEEPILAKILATMSTVFEEVFIFEVPRVTPLFANYLVVASRQKGVIKSPLAGDRALGGRLVAKFPGVPIHGVLQSWSDGLKPPPKPDLSQVLTDDRAPVEFLTDTMILRAITNPGLDISVLDH
jgi:spermidine synthase